MDAIDRVVMNTRLHHLGTAARIVEPVQKLAGLICMDASALLGARPGDAHVIRNAGGPRNRRCATRVRFRKRSLEHARS